MLVTINTDACFHTKLKYAGYAFWAVSNEFKITKSGVFKHKAHSPDDAEAKCIINALNVVLLAHTGITKIIINTDSLNATGILKRDLKHITRYVFIKKKYVEILQNQYQKVLSKTTNKVEIEFRHVKAHSNKDDARSFVNEWCDTNAKKMMWNQINNLNKNQ